MPHATLQRRQAEELRRLRNANKRLKRYLREAESYVIALGQYTVEPKCVTRWRKALK